MPSPPVLDYGRSSSWYADVYHWLGRMLKRCRVSRRTVTRIAAGLIVTVIAGYISSVVSLRGCEDDTARWVARDPLGRGSLYVGPVGGADASEVFQRIGVTRLPATRPGYDYPWGEVSRGDVRGPFLVTVGYDRARGNQGYEGSTRRYLCLFGLRIFIGNGRTMVS